MKAAEQANAISDAQATDVHQASIRVLLALQLAATEPISSLSIRCNHAIVLCPTFTDVMLTSKCCPQVHYLAEEANARAQGDGPASSSGPAPRLEAAVSLCNPFNLTLGDWNWRRPDAGKLQCYIDDRDLLRHCH